jgi:tRNA threonylcarbamoyl adenosine modification protein (Sua5/YciO/YrdC/YwlC family)
MIEYVIAHNPDDRIIDKAVDLLNQGKLICFPTDTNWIIAGSIKQKEAIAKLYKIKNESTQKHFSLLCSTISLASEYAQIEDYAFKTIRKLAPGHFTFIFEATKLTTKYIKASKTDHEVGIRFVPSILVNSILERFNDVVISTNIKPSMLGLESSEDIYSYQIEDKLAHQLSMIIDPGEFEFVGSSTILSFAEGEMELVREGAGKI